MTDLSASLNQISSIWLQLSSVPFVHDWLDANGVRTRYVRAGKRGGPVVIFLHGTAASLEMFAPNIARHAALGYDCIAIDMLGSGYTDKPDYSYEIGRYVAHLTAFMSAAQVDRASFIGCSLGSWVAARMAVDHPELTNTITLISAAGMFANRENMARIAASRMTAVGAPTREHVQAIVDRLIKRPEARWPEIVSIRQAVLAQPEMADAMPRILVLQDWEVRNRNLITDHEWRAIRCPALLIGAVDEDDEYLKTARRAAELIPRSRYIEMRNCGHWPHFEAPAEFNAQSTGFLRASMGQVS